MNIKEIMTKDIITVGPEMDVHAVAKLFVDKDISGAPVVDKNGKFLGLVLEENLIVRDKKVHLPTFIYILTGFFTIGEDKFEEEMKKIAATNVLGIMQKDVKIIKPDTSVEDVATMMVEKGVHYFPVLEDGKLIGVVTKKDIVRAIAQGKMW